MAVLHPSVDGYGCHPLEPAKADTSVDAESPGSGGSDVHRADPAWCRTRIGPEESRGDAPSRRPGRLPSKGVAMGKSRLSRR